MRDPLERKARRGNLSTPTCQGLVPHFSVRNLWKTCGKVEIVSDGAVLVPVLIVDCGLDDVLVPLSGSAFPAMLRAALYARVSDRRSAPDTPANEPGTSTLDERRRQDPNLQLIPLRALCAQRAWKPAAEYVDAISGAATSRPQLDAMMREIHAGRFEVLTVWKTDRLGRSLRHLLEIIEVCRLRGVAFCSLTEPHMDTTSPSGLLVFQILGAAAEYERSIDSERIRAGMENARRKGKQIGRRPLDISADEARAAVVSLGSIRRAAKFLNCSRSALAEILKSA